MKPHVPYCQASAFGFGLESSQEGEEGAAHLQSVFFDLVMAPFLVCLPITESVS